MLSWRSLADVYCRSDFCKFSFDISTQCKITSDCDVVMPAKLVALMNSQSDLLMWSVVAELLCDALTRCKVTSDCYSAKANHYIDVAKLLREHFLVIFQTIRCCKRICRALFICIAVLFSLALSLWVWTLALGALYSFLLRWGSVFCVRCGMGWRGIGCRCLWECCSVDVGGLCFRIVSLRVAISGDLWSAFSSLALSSRM